MCFTVRYSPDRLSGQRRIFREKSRCGGGCTLTGEHGGQNGGGAASMAAGGEGGASNCAGTPTPPVFQIGGLLAAAALNFPAPDHHDVDAKDPVLVLVEGSLNRLGVHRKPVIG